MKFYYANDTDRMPFELGVSNAQFVTKETGAFENVVLGGRRSRSPTTIVRLPKTGGQVLPELP